MDMRCGLVMPMLNENCSFPAFEMNALHPISCSYPGGFSSIFEDTRGASANVPAIANPDTPFRLFRDDAAFQLHCCQQEAEINHMIAFHGENLKQSLVEKRQQHTKVLMELIERTVIFRLREKFLEIENIRRKNAELEDHVNKLSIESQVWMNIAQRQEALVANLRSNLEQIVAQSNEKTKGRLGESEAEDAESCVYGASVGVADGGQQAHEIWEMKEQRICRFCRKKTTSVLVLPCRHLCLCTDCDPNLGNCPVCGALKDASLQVYMD
ncbi:hypothetical protein KP509_01G041600 [Ceratopteris richardii]|nr:hypothetical protein KP509_01G041600 [Ceratopteris richardii]